MQLIFLKHSDKVFGNKWISLYIHSYFTSLSVRPSVSQSVIQLLNGLDNPLVS